MFCVLLYTLQGLGKHKETILFKKEWSLTLLMTMVFVFLAILKDQ